MFYLKDKADYWLTTEPPDSIKSWDELVNKFLTWIFPSAKAAKLRIDINNFFQLEEETFYEAWERYKYLLRKCLVATPKPSPTLSVSPNQNPGTLGLFLFIFRVIKFSFSKMS